MNIDKKIEEEFLKQLNIAIKDYVNKTVDDTYKALFEDMLHCVNSNIKQFYSDYTPKYYDRHGDVSGFNLYNSLTDKDKVGLESDKDGAIGINFAPSTTNLLSYDSELDDDVILNRIAFEGVHGMLSVGNVTRTTLQGKYFTVSGTTNEILSQFQTGFKQAEKKAVDEMMEKNKHIITSSLRFLK